MIMNGVEMDGSMKAAIVLTIFSLENIRNSGIMIAAKGTIIPKPDNGRLTRNGNKLYYHLYENTIGPMPLMGIKKDQVKSIRYLATGAEVPISTSWVHTDYPDIVFADLGPNPILPDGVDTVLEVTLKD